MNYYTIDQAVTTPNAPHPEYTVDPSNNRLLAPSGFTHESDAAGNQTRKELDRMTKSETHGRRPKR